MKKLIRLCAACSMAAALSASALAAPAQYSDVPQKAWYAQYVYDLSEKGIINGYEDGTFKPDKAVEYSSALKLILRAAGYPEQPPTEESWAGGYLQLAVNEGFLPARQYDLSGTITRLQVAQLACRALKLQTTLTKTPFADSTDPEVLALFEAGILTGINREGKTYFDGEKTLQRSEISTIVWRMERLAKEEKPVVPQPIVPQPEPIVPPTEPAVPPAEPIVPPTDPDDQSGAHQLEPADPAPDTQQPADPSEPPKTITYGKYTVDVLPDVPVFSLDREKFAPENGRMTYADRDVRLEHGIDVSKYQGEIDWERVKRDGIDFAVIRLGYRGYTEGTLNIDEAFARNIEGAQKAGLEVGVYFYSQAITEMEGLEEAEYVLEALRPYSIDGPVVFDWELTGKEHARTYGLDTDTLCAAANAFCGRIRQAGYEPMIYFNSYAGYVKYDLSRVLPYGFWFAQYSDRPEFYYDFQMWQYTSHGEVDGIEGRCDLNVRFVPRG